ncbi:Nitrogen permease regulator 3-like protein [Porphyridium purpureum]|uniref:Nitrogen permease regulator 3-like protein n=1 Tax=Porphyridium purpureum TaxID=35688 RepID=A0A5J4Z2X8_PORPP|nr:Nitrogen permease regulator 3-like protein [Porphyridium purpureum]|eukprot:POR8062..scf295_1
MTSCAPCRKRVSSTVRAQRANYVRNGMTVVRSVSCIVSGGAGPKLAFHRVAQGQPERAEAAGESTSTHHDARMSASSRSSASRMLKFQQPSEGQASAAERLSPETGAARTSFMDEDMWLLGSTTAQDFNRSQSSPSGAVPPLSLKNSGTVPLGRPTYVFAPAAPTDIGWRVREKPVLDELSEEAFIKLMSLDPSLCNTTMKVRVGAIRFIGYPVRISPDELQPNESDKASQPAAARASFSASLPQKRTVSYLNVVCGFHVSGDGFDSASETVCEKVVKAVACAFAEEERRCGYMTLGLVHDSAREDDSPALSSAAATADNLVDGSDGSVMADHCQVLDHVMHLLYTGQSGCVTVNAWISIQVPPLPTFNHVAEPKPIHPFDSFLSYERAGSRTLSQIPQDTLLSEFLERVSPFVSFEQLQLSLNVPMEAVIRLAAMAEEWGLGCVIATITTESHLCIHPGLDLQDLNEMAQKFAIFTSRFRARQWSLHGLLFQFSKSQSLSQHFASLGSGDDLLGEFFECVKWMLANELIAGVKRFVAVSSRAELEETCKELESIGSSDHAREYNALLPFEGMCISIEVLLWELQWTSDQILRLEGASPRSAIRIFSVADFVHP